MWSHQRQSQVVAALGREREAYQTAPVRGHEIDDLRSDFFRGNRQVAFILPVFIVNDNQNAPGADLLDRFGNGDEGHIASF
jgi:hypothetical protein